MMSNHRYINNNIKTADIKEHGQLEKVETDVAVIGAGTVGLAS